MAVDGVRPSPHVLVVELGGESRRSGWNLGDFWPAETCEKWAAACFRHAASVAVVPGEKGAVAQKSCIMESESESAEQESEGPQVLSQKCDSERSAQRLGGGGSE